MPGGDNTTEVEVEGASAASFSAPVAGYFGRMENFDPKVEEWSTYIERLEMFFVVNNVPNEKKAASLFTSIGGKMYALLKSLTTPTKPTELLFTEIVEVMGRYLTRKPIIITESASDDIPHADEVRTLIKDIWDLRIAKLRKSIDIMVSQQEVYARLDDLSLMEINVIRPFLTQALDHMHNLRCHVAENPSNA